ncbi:low specificity L-threonine aldolase [Oscillospiraceae bacterium HV4-5-C5C]|nr:low specificity L-threonine aldolase [Oscillospiraceae bacterium HV4-5-C5C]
MYCFNSDYLEGAHPRILQRLAESNLVQTPGYGLDPYCESARAKIRAACHCPGAAVHFLAGGTQTNATVIGALLRSYEGVLAADTAHINGHEAGAIEKGGHKVLTLPGKEGKISAEQIRDYLEAYQAEPAREHLVRPGMVYISQPTEIGSLYSSTELSALANVCHHYGLPLYLDGARLGYGLAALTNDVDLPFIARCCDAFYIGGTKVGALFGEAVVLPEPRLIPGFFSIIKQNGALMAKGRILGLQFDTLFTDDLYLQISRHAIIQAERLKQGLQARDCPFYYASPTNQQFIILSEAQADRLSPYVSWEDWQKLDESHSVVRLATSWATPPEAVDCLLSRF